MTTSELPTADIFLAHLGKPLDSIDVAVFKYANKPNFALPEHSPIGGVFFTAQGFSVAFCPPDFYHSDDRLAAAPTIITGVQFYSGDPFYGQAQYTSKLPHNVSFDHSRDALIEKLGPSKWRFPFMDPIKLERWDFADHWLLVRYTDDMSRVMQVQVGLKPKKPKPSVLPKVLRPDIQTLQSLFEKDWKSVAAHPDFVGADFSEVPQSSDGSSKEVDESKTRGVEFYFRPSRKTGENFYLLSGARYIRKGLFFSKGFDGELPKGIRFEDTPDIVVKKVGSFPVTGDADELDGYYVWKLPEYLLHVGFSVMEQRVSRIYIAAHPYYSPELLESPKLEAPQLRHHSDTLPKSLQDVWKKENA